MRGSSRGGLAAFVTALALVALPLVAVPGALRVAALTLVSWLGQVPLLWLRASQLLG